MQFIDRLVDVPGVLQRLVRSWPRMGSRITESSENVLLDDLNRLNKNQPTEKDESGVKLKELKRVDIPIPTQQQVPMIRRVQKRTCRDRIPAFKAYSSRTTSTNHNSRQSRQCKKETGEKERRGRKVRKKEKRVEGEKKEQAREIPRRERRKKQEESQVDSDLR